MVQEMRWVCNVEVVLHDGSSLGEARLRLRRFVNDDGSSHWTGSLRTPIQGGTKRWPQGQLVTLRLPNGQAARVYLDPEVREVGPVMLQIAQVRGEGAEFESLLREPDESDADGSSGTATDMTTWTVTSA